MSGLWLFIKNVVVTTETTMAIRMGMDIASFLFSMGILNCKDYKCYRILPILYWMGVWLLLVGELLKLKYTPDRFRYCTRDGIGDATLNASGDGFLDFAAKAISFFLFFKFGLLAS